MRRLPVIALFVLIASGLSGCIAINGASSTQPQSMGPVRLTVSACASGSPGCNGPTNNGSAYGVLNEVDSDQTLDVQVLLAVRLPDGSTPPDQLSGQLSGGAPLQFSRSTSYESDLQALEPAPAGERWWGWLSGVVTYGRKTTQGFGVNFNTTLPAPAGEGPLPSPMRWRPVVGVRYADSSNPPARAVDCGTMNSELYAGYSEGGSGSSTVVCIDSPTPDAARGFLDAPITDFGIEGTTAQAPAGSTITTTFIARRSGAADAATTFALAASGGPPGGTVALDRNSVSLGGDAVTAVLATVTIPPGTPPGSYPVVLTGTANGKPTRSGTVTVTVPAPPVATPTPAPTGTPAPPGADRTAPAIRAASLSKRRFRAAVRGLRLTLDLSEAAATQVVVERLRPGRRVGTRCSTTAKRGRRCTAVSRAATRRLTLGAGVSRSAFSARALRPGSYRLSIVATDAAGNRSAARTVRFTVLPRR